MKTIKIDDGTQVAENKIIVVKLCDGKGEEVDRKYSKAHIDLISPKGNVLSYKVSERMYRFLSAQSKNGKIYDMGGIEDNPESCLELSVGFGGRTVSRYQFIREEPEGKDMYEMFGFDMEDEKYKHPWMIELRLEDLMEKADE